MHICVVSGTLPKDSKLTQGDEVPLIIILTVCAVGMVLLGLNVLLILYLIRRRKRKQQKGQQMHQQLQQQHATKGMSMATNNPQWQLPADLSLV